MTLLEVTFLRYFAAVKKLLSCITADMRKVLPESVKTEEGMGEGLGGEKREETSAGMQNK